MLTNRIQRSTIYISEIELAHVQSLNEHLFVSPLMRKYAK